jgi:glycosyltransferase involved in cell wall biosynthesis
MKIAFHSNQLGLRGTEVALYDYAYYNREVLGNESIIFSDKNSDLTAYSKFKMQFEILLYENFQQTFNWVDRYGVDAVYYIKAGNNDGRIVPNAKNLIHTVFQVKQPHGDTYAYVSKWLADHMSEGSLPYVPHMVNILKYDHEDDYREFLSIPKQATVFGYYGGSDSFNIDFAKKAVVDVARTEKNTYFIFMNVSAFCDEPNVFFLEGTTDIHKKVGFINTCDACIHARNGGESFGLTVAEFSSKNKPVITTTYCTQHLNDLAHIEMLGDRALIYFDYNSLVDTLRNFNDIKTQREDWNAYSEYIPEKVMQQFKQVFLN